MEEFIKQNPGKRIFVHCKGGRGRAAVMTTAYYLKVQNGSNPKDIVTMLKSKRGVVSTAVLKYPALLQYHEFVSGGSSLSSKEGDKSRQKSKGS